MLKIFKSSKKKIKGKSSSKSKKLGKKESSSKSKKLGKKESSSKSKKLGEKKSTKIIEPTQIINSYTEENVSDLINKYEEHLKEFSHNPKLVHLLNNKYLSLVDNNPKTIKFNNYLKKIQIDENSKCEVVNHFLNDIKENPSNYKEQGIELIKIKNAIYIGFWASGGNANHLFHKKSRLSHEDNITNFLAKLELNTKCESNTTDFVNTKNELKKLIKNEDTKNELIKDLEQIDTDGINVSDPNVLNKYKKYEEYSSLLNTYDKLYQENNCSGGWMF